MKGPRRASRVIHERLNDEEKQGVCDILARHVVNKFKVNNEACQILESWWTKLCQQYLERVVIRRTWMLREAIQWADQQVGLYLNGKSRL